MYWDNEPEWTKLKIPVMNNGSVVVYWPAFAACTLMAIMLNAIGYFIIGLIIGAALKYFFDNE